MSTRCNIQIKKGDRGVQIFCPHDGEPNGVGRFLYEYFGEAPTQLFSSPTKLGKWLCDEDRDNEFKYEGNIKNTMIADGAEYLYVLDLDEETLTCYDVNDGEENEVIFKSIIWGDFDCIILKEDFFDKTKEEIIYIIKTFFDVNIVENTCKAFLISANESGMLPEYQGKEDIKEYLVTHNPFTFLIESFEDEPLKKILWTEFFT